MVNHNDALRNPAGHEVGADGFCYTCQAWPSRRYEHWLNVGVYRVWYDRSPAVPEKMEAYDESEARNKVLDDLEQWVNNRVLVDPRPSASAYINVESLRRFVAEMRANG